MHREIPPKKKVDRGSKKDKGKVKVVEGTVAGEQDDYCDSWVIHPVLSRHTSNLEKEWCDGEVSGG